MKDFDENDAIKFIRHRYPELEVSDNDILDVISSIYDYYEEIGELDIDFDDDAADTEIDYNTDSITDFVCSAIPGNKLSRNDIRNIIESEILYEESLID